MRKEGVSNKSTSGKRIVAEEISNAKALKQGHLVMQVRECSCHRMLGDIR